MRTLQLTVMMLATGFAAFAQARPQQPANPASPEVHEDGRVTFRLKVPDAKMVTVVDGSPNGSSRRPQGSQEGRRRRLEPHRRSAQTRHLRLRLLNRRRPPHARSGQPQSDPPHLGPNQLRRSAGPDGPSFDSIRNVPHGTVSKHTYNSQSLGVIRQFLVYTPPGYENDFGQVPRAYLFHGSGGGETQWTTVGRADMILDNLIADGKAVPMVVVMPYGHVPAREGGNATDDFEKDLLQDVKPTVEKLYRVRTDRANRAIAGLSMGSGQSLHIGLGHLDMFSYVAVFSGGGRNQGIEDMSAEEINKKLKVFYIGCGKTDFVFESATALDKLLTDKRIHHKYTVTEGGHTWPNWRYYLNEYAQMLFQK